MDWPDGYTDRRGFRGPWQLRQGWWQRRVAPMSLPAVLRPDTDYQVRSDGYGNDVDAMILGPIVASSLPRTMAMGA